MTTFSDEIATKLRDYVVDGDPGSGYYAPQIPDIRAILTTLALGTYAVAEVSSFLLAASVADARAAIGLGSASSPTFAALTVTGNLVVDTSTLSVDATNNRVGIGVASPTTGLDVDLAADFSNTVAFGGATTFTALAAMTGATGKLSIGNATIPTVGSLSGVESLSVTGTGNPASMSVSRFSADAVGPVLTLYKSRSGSIGSHTALQTNDVLGEVVFGGSTGAAAGAGARIAALAASNATTGSLPTDLVFATTASGAATPTNRMRLDSIGRLVMGHTAAIDTSAISVNNVAATGVLGSIAIHDWAASSQAPRIKIVKSRSATVGTAGAALSANDYLGIFQFIGDKGDTALVEGGRLGFFAEAGWTTTSTPTALQVMLTPSGSTSASEVLRVDGTGFLSLNGDTDTGLRRPAANEIALVAGGAEGVRAVSGSGVWFGGQTAHVTVNSYNAMLQLHHTSNPNISRGRWSNNSAGYADEHVKSRGAAVGTNAAVQAGDIVKQDNYWGDHGAGLALLGLSYIDVGSISGTTVRGRFRWFIRDEFNTTQEAFRINETGAIFAPRVGTTASAANAFLDSGSSPANQLLRSTSSRRYKQSISVLLDSDADVIDQLRPITYRSRAAADDPNRQWFGFIAEEVAEIDSRLVHYTRESEGGDLIPDGVQYDRIVVPLVSRVQAHGARIAALEAELAALKAA